LALFTKASICQYQRWSLVSCCEHNWLNPTEICSIYETMNCECNINGALNRRIRIIDSKKSDYFREAQICSLNSW
jgi:hypothetical protein